MKTKKIYLVVNNIYNEDEPAANDVKGVFFNKQNAQWFARQLMQEDQITKTLNVYIIKKYKLQQKTSAININA